MNSKSLLFPGLVAVGMTLFSSTGVGQVRINEIMADNGGSVIASGGGAPDYIELYNTGGSPVSLDGWKLTDTLYSTNATAFTFPAGTMLGGGAYLVLWLDAQTNGPGPGLHVTSLSLSSAGEAVSLFNSGGVMQDYVTFGLQVKDKPLARFPDGTGKWTLGNPTPGGTNVALTLGTQLALRLNEWLPTNSAGADRDRLELYNPATNGPVSLGGSNGIQITGSLSVPDTSAPLILSNSFIAAGGFVRFNCENKKPNPGEAADKLSFRLSSTSGETISMYLSNRVTLIDRITFGTFTNLPLLGRDISMGRFPDGGTNIVFFYTNDTTLGSANTRATKLTNVVVSEILSHTDLPLEDALELYNPTDSSVDMSGWWISNSEDTPFKFRVPAGTILADGGYKVFYEQNRNSGATNGHGFNHNGTDTAPEFTFNSAHGDEVVLTYFAPSPQMNNSNTVFQYVHAFDAAENAVSYGRHVKSDGGTDVVPMRSRTFGSDNPATVAQFRAGTGLGNAYPKVGPLVISEIMYRPPDIGTNDNSLDEYLELASITNGVLPLYHVAYPTNTWSVAGAVTFTFPTNVSLPPFGRLLLVNFDPVTNAFQLASFRALYEVSPGVPVFGPYGGKLNNKNDTITLYKPDAVQLPPKPDAGFVPRVFVEKVKYEDTAPWPADTDGTGLSLQRLSLTGYANDHTNWYSGPPTVGRTNAQPVQVVALGTTGDSFRLRVGTTPGRAYIVEGSTNLAANAWVSITNFTATSVTTYVTNTSALNLYRWRFYRAKGL